MLVSVALPVTVEVEGGVFVVVLVMACSTASLRADGRRSREGKLHPSGESSLPASKSRLPCRADRFLICTRYDLAHPDGG